MLWSKVFLCNGINFKGGGVIHYRKTIVILKFMKKKIHLQFVWDENTILTTIFNYLFFRQSAFDFALQFTGSMGKAMSEPAGRKRLPLADIVKGFESVPGSRLDIQQQKSVQSTPVLSKRKHLSFADIGSAYKSVSGCELEQQQSVFNQSTPVLADRKSLSLADIATAFKSVPGCGSGLQQQQRVRNQSTPALAERRSLSLIDLVTTLKSVPECGLDLQQQSNLEPTTLDFAESRRFSRDDITTAFEFVSELELRLQQQSVSDQHPAERTFDSSTRNDGGSPWLSSCNAQPVSKATDSNADDNVSIRSVYLSLNPSRKTSETNNDHPFPRRWFDDEESIRSMYFSLNPSRKTSETSHDYPFPYTVMPPPLTENPPLRDLLIEALMILNEAETNGITLDH